MGGDELNPKRQITRYSLRCPSLEPPPPPPRATHQERVCHAASLRHPRTRTGPSDCRSTSTAPNEVRSPASWPGMKGLGLNAYISATASTAKTPLRGRRRCSKSQHPIVPKQTSETYRPIQLSGRVGNVWACCRWWWWPWRWP